MDETQLFKAQQLIDDKACILFDRIAWGKNWTVTILPPPPHSDSVLRDEEPVGNAKYGVYLTVIDMAESVLNEAKTRGLPDDFPCVFRIEDEELLGISTLKIVLGSLSSNKKKYLTN